MTNENNEQNAKLHKPHKKWKRWLVLALVLIIGSTQFLNHTGFCYSEMRYLSERELVDRFLFGSNFEQMKYEEKVATAKLKEMDYPYCCGAPSNIYGGHIYLNDFEYKLGIIFLAQKLYSFSVYGHRSLKEVGYSEKPYYYHMQVVDSCGNRFYSNFRKDMSEQEYNVGISGTKKSWTMLKQ